MNTITITFDIRFLNQILFCYHFKVANRIKNNNIQRDKKWWERITILCFRLLDFQFELSLLRRKSAVIIVRNESVSKIFSCYIPREWYFMSESCMLYGHSFHLHIIVLMLTAKLTRFLFGSVCFASKFWSGQIDMGLDRLNFEKKTQTGSDLATKLTLVSSHLIQWFL